MARQRSVDKLRAKVRALEAENYVLGERVWDLTLALLEKPVPKECPPSRFPDISFAITEPPPEHPDGHDEHVIIAALFLDPTLPLCH